MNAEQELEDLQKQLDAKYKKWLKSVSPLKEKISTLKAELASNKKKCKHTKTEEFEWYWDNGYGEQKMLPGLLCKSCGKRNNWPGMSSHWG